MELLDKAAILAAEDRQYEDVEVPAWGGTVRVAQLTTFDQLGLERLGESNGVAPEVKERQQTVAFMALALVNADLTPLFTEEEVDALMARHAWAVVKPILEAATRVNNEESPEKKDSGETTGSDSPSASPPDSAEVSATP